MTKIIRTAVTSSQIASVGYSEGTKELDIEFKSFRKPKPGQPEPAKSVYRYQNVTPTMHAEFMAAESKGKWFGANLKPLAGSYPFRKLSPEESAQ